MNHSYFGCPLDDKYAIHERLGDAIVVVNPLLVELYIADGEAIDEVCSRKDFPNAGDFCSQDICWRRCRFAVQPVDLLYVFLDVFGRNVDSVEGEEWQRHRKITSPPFNKRNSNMV